MKDTIEEIRFALKELTVPMYQLKLLNQALFDLRLGPLASLDNIEKLPEEVQNKVLMELSKHFAIQKEHQMRTAIKRIK